jgi:hypothetical protein
LLVDHATYHLHTARDTSLRRLVIPSNVTVTVLALSALFLGAGAGDVGYDHCATGNGSGNGDGIGSKETAERSSEGLLCSSLPQSSQSSLREGRLT